MPNWLPKSRYHHLFVFRPDTEEAVTTRMVRRESAVFLDEEERRRLALFLHDVPVQAMSGIMATMRCVMTTLAQDGLDDRVDHLGLRYVGQASSLRRYASLRWPVTFSWMRSELLPALRMKLSADLPAILLRSPPAWTPAC